MAKRIENGQAGGRWKGRGGESVEALCVAAVAAAAVAATV